MKASLFFFVFGFGAVAVASVGSAYLVGARPESVYWGVTFPALVALNLVSYFGGGFIGHALVRYLGCRAAAKPATAAPTTDPRIAGRNAYRNGRTMNANPYWRGTSARSEWAMGWFDASSDGLNQESE